MSMKLRIQSPKIDLADEFEAEFKKTAQKAVRDAGKILLAEIKRLLTLRIGETSPPGEPPSKQSGELLASWKLGRIWTGKRAVSVKVVTDHPGAYPLEFGEVSGSAKQLGKLLRAAARADSANLGKRGGLRQSVQKKVREQAAAEARPTERRAPRPYIRPALINVEPKIAALFEERFGSRAGTGGTTP